MRWIARILALVAAGVALTAPAHAQVFRYTDDNGNSFYVNGLENVPERHRGRAVPLIFPTAPASEPAPATAETPAKPGGGAIIKYVPGQRILVDARINGSGAVRLLLDTGADRTLISPRALQAAGVSIARPIATGQMTGVTGTDRLNYVMIESLEIGEARVGRMPVASYEMPGGAEGDGLLGRDFLDQFKVNIDSSRGEVTLAPK